MTRRKNSNTRRRAFTLLEMMLALAIGVMLLTAVYLSLGVYLKTVESGRTQIDQATVARAVVKRLTSDVTVNLAMLPPLAAPSSGKGSGSGAANTASTSGTSASSTSTTNNYPFVFNLGIQGDQNTLTLYLSKTSQSNVQMATDGTQPQSDQPLDSDLRRVTYWLVTDGNKKGLARQDVKWVTSPDEINNMPPNVGDTDTLVFAEGVIDATFEYFDGTNWQTSWDGTTIVNNPSANSGSSTTSGMQNTTGQSATGVAPPTANQPWVGPPLAIRITLKIGRTDGKDTDPNDPTIMTYKHVIHIPTAVVNSQTAGSGAQDQANSASPSSTSGNGP